MSQPLRLGIAGLGTVGVGVVKIIRKQAALLQARTGREITISAVSARSKGRDRGVALDSYAWEDDPVALAKRDDVDGLLLLFLHSSSLCNTSIVVLFAAFRTRFCSRGAVLLAPLAARIILLPTTAGKRPGG